MPQTKSTPTRGDRVARMLKLQRGVPKPGKNGNWIQRAAAVVPDTVNQESRTINAVVATENPVLFYNRETDQVYQEVLLATGAILPEWAPLLREHQRYYLEADLGSVLNLARSGSTITAQLVFGVMADVQPVWERYRDGHLRAVSVGGRRRAFVDISARQSAMVAGRRWVAGERPLRITTSWVVQEVSAVLFGGDDAAVTRRG